ncbi:molybdopterin synthase sulfur carrier subunit [bacterium MnTg02]|nr:molybdopterin synthase sulfur carrier subunit [bacterium MnTg02]
MKLLYFAWVREKAGIDREDVDLPDDIETIADVMAWLKTRGPEFESAFEASNVIRAAIDQTHVKHTTAIAGATEIAFFPPVTGG